MKSRYGRMHGLDGRVGVLTERKKVDFRQMLESVTEGGACFLPVGIQVVFEVFRWMMSTAAETDVKWVHRDPNHRRYPHVPEAIRTDTSGLYRPAPFRADWRTDIAERMRRALTLDGHVACWREEQRLDPSGWRRLRVLAYDNPMGEGGFGVGERGVAEALDALFALNSPERRLTVQLNMSHPEARRVDDIRLHPTADGWIAAMSYGFDGSHWHADYRGLGMRGIGPDLLRAFQRRDEPFYDFILRARRRLERILTPPCNRRPPQRDPVCLAGWTGKDEGGWEHIGGVNLHAYASRLDLASERDGFSPVILASAAEPIEIQFKDGAYMGTVVRHGGWRDEQRFSAETVREGRARYLLRCAAIRRSYLGPRARSAADKILAPGNLPGGAIREREEAARFQQIRPTAFEQIYASGAQETCEP